jgi:hypothetical protein
MKGKKSDPEFVASFIQESAQQGSITSEQIVSRAQSMINQIDQEIREIEDKKKLRGKLLDVVSALEERVQPDKTVEAKLLPFFDLKYPIICKEICQTLKHQKSFTPLANYKGYDLEVKFCLKQLLLANIIARVGDHFEQGTRFEEYLQFVLGEAK